MLVVWSATGSADEWNYDVGAPTADCMARLDAAQRIGRNREDYVSWAWDPWRHQKLYYGGFLLKTRDYEAMREIALAVHHITQDAPVIGLGRSPFAVTTILSFLNPGRVTDLPISDFRSRPAGPGSLGPLPTHYQTKAAEFEPLSPELELKLFAHFDQTILTFLRAQRQPVYLLDLGESGASTFATARYLKRYARARDLAVSFEIILFTTPFFSKVIDEMAPFFGLNARKIVLENNQYVGDILARDDRGPRWKQHSPYGEFDFQMLNKHGAFVYNRFSEELVAVGQGQPNPGHGRFKTAVYANMLSDPHFAEYKLGPLSLGVPDVRWDAVARVYRDKDGSVVPLSTGD